MITLDLTKIYAKNPDTENYVEVNWGDINVFSRSGIDTSDATALASDILLGQTAYARGAKITGSYVPLDTSDATATANVILKNETAYVDGVKITGTIESLERTVYMPSTTNQTIPANQYLSGDQIIMGDANLRPEFIKKDVLLFNTTGTYEGTDTSDATATSSDILLNKTAYVNGIKITGEIESLSSTIYTPTTSNQTIPAGKYIAENLTILGDNNLNAGNIKKDISIFGVVGTLEDSGIDTSDATATAEDIMLGETAYANGIKLTGTHVDLDTSDATATAEDIMLGETAYANGIKLTGTHVDLDTSDATATSNDLVSGKTAYANGVKITGAGNVMDTTEPLSTTASSSNVQTGMSAYVNGVRIVGIAEPLVMSGDDVSYTPTTTDQVITGPRILQGNKTMTIKGDSDLIASNIKNGVEIFGVTGTYEGSGSGIDTSDATATAADIMNGETAYVKGAKITGTYVPLDTSDATATSGDMKAGVTAYVDGNKITGDAYTRTSQVNAVADGLIDGSTHWLQAGFYNGIAFEAEPNLLPENIKDGVTIYGTTGTYTGGSGFEYNIFDASSATSAQDIVDEYGGLITTYDGGNFNPLAIYEYNTNPVGAEYNSTYSGIFTNPQRNIGGFYTNIPYNISGSFYLDLIWYVSTWANPTIKLCLISATDISDLQNKIINRNFDYSFDYVAANTFNNQEMYFKITGVLLNDYYIYLEIPTNTQAQQAIITKIQITGV